jgi:hypothetical protein
MLNDGILPKYVLVEFDLLLKRKDMSGSTDKLFGRMLSVGYRILKNDNYNITFELK